MYLEDAQRRWRVHVEDGRGARSDGGLTDGEKRDKEGRESAHMLALLQPSTSFGVRDRLACRAQSMSPEVIIK